METLKAPSFAEKVADVEQLEVMSETQASKILKAMGDTAVLKTTFEVLAEAEKEQPVTEASRRVLAGPPTTYSMPEGDPDFMI